MDCGSWGTIGGMDVVVGDSSDMPRLLGSIDSAIKQADGDGPKVAIASENRIMVVCCCFQVKLDYSPTTKKWPFFLDVKRLFRGNLVIQMLVKKLTFFF